MPRLTHRDDAEENIAERDPAQQRPGGPETGAGRFKRGQPAREQQPCSCERQRQHRPAEDLRQQSGIEFPGRQAPARQLAGETVDGLEIHHAECEREVNRRQCADRGGQSHPQHALVAQDHRAPGGDERAQQHEDDEDHVVFLVKGRKQHRRPEGEISAAAGRMNLAQTQTPHTRHAMAGMSSITCRPHSAIRARPSASTRRQAR